MYAMSSGGLPDESGPTKWARPSVTTQVKREYEVKAKANQTIEVAVAVAVAVAIAVAVNSGQQ